MLQLVDSVDDSKLVGSGATQLYELEITLEGAHVDIDRRVLVPGEATLGDLHAVIQLAMGWADCHLHAFREGDGTSYGDSSIGGHGVCPPEDCGGVWGYAGLCETLDDPRHGDHEEIVEWMREIQQPSFEPSQFDPSAFDLETANEAVRTLLDRSRSGS